MTSALPFPSDLPEGVLLQRVSDVNRGQVYFPDAALNSNILVISTDIQLEEAVSMDLPVDTVLYVLFQERSKGLVRFVSWGNATLYVHAAEESDAQVILEVGEAGTVIQRSTLGDNAQLHWHNVTLGTGKIEQSLVSQAKGVNASSSVSWLFYAKNKDEYQLTCRNIFDAQNGGGEIIMKGVSENTAHASAKGMIDIGLKGNGTDTYLTQNVLMLDSTSKVDAVPSLEIKTNDVKASHSATVSRVTEEDLFYFASRGIDAHEARGMYVQGFLADLTSSIRSSRASEAILGAIERKYAQKL